WFNLPAELFRGRHLRFPISAHQRPAATSVCACVISYSRVSRDAYVRTLTGRGSTGKLTFWLVLAVAVCAMKTLLFVCVFVAALTGVVYAQSKSSEERACNLKGNCEECLAGNSSINLECYWCDKPSNRSGPKCRHYTFNSAIPVDGIECEDLMYKYASCRLSALVVVILITLSCLILLIIICCVSCCCCFYFARRRQHKRLVEDQRYLEKKEHIREEHNIKRIERKTKYDDIKRKYGLKTDDDGEVAS
ncbi:hypothetical protein GBAR_LOCUS18677, partial [Geodia barretti]